MRDVVIVACIAAALIVAGFSFAQCHKTCAEHCAAGRGSYKAGCEAGKCECYAPPVTR